MIYYEYLLSLARDKIHPTKEYNLLLTELDKIEYRYRFILDENRDKSGRNLRSRFGYENGVDVDDIRYGPASILEVLLGLSLNMADQTECDSADMFWLMIRNLGLERMRNDRFDSMYVGRVVNTWIDGLFSPDGTGSPFPLHNYHGDATRMDLYSLMNEYIYENYNERWILT